MGSSTTTNNIPASFFELINSCSLEQKKSMLVALNRTINNDIKKRSNVDINCEQYVKHIKNFLPDNYLDAEVYADIEELGLLRKSRKPVTQWLSSDSRDYCFSDNPRLKHPAKDIKRYPGICKLMDLVNKESNTTQNADAALVIVYNTNSSGINFHNDGEKIIDHGSSISTLTFGATRTIDFCRNGVRPHMAEYSVEAGEHDLMIMKPGCQEHLVHRVNPGNQPDDVRVVISFRKLTPFSNETVEDTRDPVSLSPKAQKGTVTRVNLIAGDSFSAALDADRLGRFKRKNVVNVSKGGATIQDVMGQLNEYYTSKNNNNVLVEKVFISVGANDIRHCRVNGVRHLKSPLVHLARQVKLLFPDAAIWFQCIIPLPLQHDYSVRNVEGYNRLLYEVCSYTGAYLLDVFDKFLCLNLASGNYYRRESYFIDSKNIHPNKVGLSVLAKGYIKVIHSNRHNPFGY